VIERAVVLGRGPKITVEDLPVTIASTHSLGQSAGLSYSQNIEAYRRQVILNALSEAQGNRAAAAKALGLQRTYLSRLIKTLHIT
jgi:DNA-binding NtrC family response regulator